MSNKIDKLKATDYAKKEFKAVKKQLPSFWKEMLIERYPQYASREGRILLSRVDRGINNDMLVILRLKEIAKEYQQK